MSFKPFHPTAKTLMGPGPSNVHDRVLQAMARPTIGHLDPEFIQVMDDIKVLMRRAFRTENALTFPVSAPGSAGMETCIVNLVEPGDKVIVCINGVFGGRQKENVERAGGTVVTVEDDWGRAVDLEKVRAALVANPDAKLLSFVHAETSTGASSDAKAICALAQEHGVLTIADTVTSLAGSPLLVDDWGIDAVYSGTQKCLSCPPGLSPITFGPRAVEVIKARKTKVQSWFLDLSLVINYWEGEGARSYHHTAPVNAMYGLHEALLMVDEEGLEAAWKRHSENHQRLKSGLEAMGFSWLPPEGERLPQLNTVYLPGGIENEGVVRRRLLDNHQLEVGAGLGQLAGKIWRVGLMGQTSRPDHVDYFLNAVREEIGR
ncbi:MAG: alanine--glyoxylate aminotransferase family protein [Pseudomonadota bacterium]